MVDYKVDFKSLEWQDVGPDVRYKVLAEDGTQVRLLEFDKGYEDQVWCDKAHSGYVLEGQMEIAFEGETVRYSAGDGIIIPGGDRHKHKTHILSDKAKVILIEGC